MGAGEGVERLFHPSSCRSRLAWWVHRGNGWQWTLDHPKVWIKKGKGRAGEMLHSAQGTKVLAFPSWVIGPAGRV